MATDPRKLRPSELCRLLNSTPLGEVINEPQLRRHRTRAGLRLGDGGHVDLLRYVAWLVEVRHAPKSTPPAPGPPEPAAWDAAAGAAALASQRQKARGDGQKLVGKQEVLIAALLTEPSYAAAAAQVGISQATVYRWLQLPVFRAAYRQTRRGLVESAVGRIQAASGQAVETLLHVARHGRRDADRVRAAVALLDRAVSGLADAELLHAEPEPGVGASLESGDVVKLVAAQLQLVDQSELPTAEKARLTASLAETLLRAIGVEVLDKRLEALERVLLERKD